MRRVTTVAERLGDVRDETSKSEERAIDAGEERIDSALSPGAAVKFPCTAISPGFSWWLSSSSSSSALLTGLVPSMFKGTHL